MHAMLTVLPQFDLFSSFVSDYFAKNARFVTQYLRFYSMIRQIIGEKSSSKIVLYYHDIHAFFGGPV